MWFILEQCQKKVTIEFRPSTSFHHCHTSWMDTHGYVNSINVIRAQKGVKPASFPRPSKLIARDVND